jgi:hypothetical protein
MTLLDLSPFSTTPIHDCDCCGTSPAEYFESLSLYICKACDMPQDARATREDYAVWRALMLSAAGQRKLRNLTGAKVSAWFLERYERLGLRR